METHFSICAWEVPQTEEPGGYSLRGCKELDTTEQLNKKQRAQHTVGNVRRHTVFTHNITDAGLKSLMHEKFSHLQENGQRYQ